jgi:hypothetical protein
MTGTGRLTRRKIVGVMLSTGFVRLRLTTPAMHIRPLRGRKRCVGEDDRDGQTWTNTDEHGRTRTASRGDRLPRCAPSQCQKWIPACAGMTEGGQGGRWIRYRVNDRFVYFYIKILDSRFRGNDTGCGNDKMEECWIGYRGSSLRFVSRFRGNDRGGTGWKRNGSLIRNSKLC